ncbi:hypothetical protein [Parendozoicomonas haliclonae]|uniref:Ubiquitin fusion degradation protein UFD1 n=1 Tax=Parendozoicomonas haliclonae TaxID=1960125 RepID=A0A1X7AP66_9GAMM|nr:hypothetical protein [Parendozoicomonas haliclonae]SMA48996.1 Ubiquitin fusion degradation protein UFD1 [Parendozoicomonas haliclonae]
MGEVLCQRPTGARYVLGFRLLTVMFCLWAVLCRGDIDYPAMDLPPDPFPAASPEGLRESNWFASTEEGSWLDFGLGPFFLQGLKPTTAGAQLGVLAGLQSLSWLSGSEWLARQRWAMPESVLSVMNKAGLVYGIGSAAWYLSDALDKSGWLPAEQVRIPLTLAVPELSSQLFFQLTTCASAAPECGSSVLTILRNPLQTPTALEQDQPYWVQTALYLNEVMAGQGIERIDMELYQVVGRPGLKLGWRTEDQQWHWLNLDSLITAENGAQWLHGPPVADGRLYISALQVELLSAVSRILERARSTEFTEIPLPLLDYELSESRSSYLLESGERPILVQQESRGGSLSAVSVEAVGQQSQAFDRLRLISEAWTAAGQGLLNVGMMFAWYRYLQPWLQPEGRAKLIAARRASGEGVTTRLQLLQAGKVASVSGAAATTRKIAGKPYVVKVGHSGRYKDSNFIALPEKLTEELLVSVDAPWNFELTGTDGRKGWAVNDANRHSKHDNEILMSQHMMNRLKVHKGSEINLQPVRLPLLKDLEISVVGGKDPLNDNQIAAIVSEALDKRYWTIHEGEVIRTSYQNKPYAFKVERMLPGGAAYNGVVGNVERSVPLHVLRPERWPEYIPAAVRESGEAQAFTHEGHVLRTGKVVKTTQADRAAINQNNPDLAEQPAQRYQYEVPKNGQATGYRKSKP